MHDKVLSFFSTIQVENKAEIPKFLLGKKKKIQTLLNSKLCLIPCIIERNI